MAGSFNDCGMINTEFNRVTLFVRERDGQYRQATRGEIFQSAKTEIDAIFSRESDLLEDPGMVKSYLRNRLAHYSNEVFGALWMDNRHRAITFDEISHGTINSATVSPREVVRSAIEYNAAACILTHNHPSGLALPSDADKVVTRRVKEALETIGTRTLDHIIVAEDSYSFAEHGIL